MSLYRIKPLEWVIAFPLRWKALGYVIDECDGKFFWEAIENPKEQRASSLDEAKAACESHRRKLLEAELEPAYRPTTELPTEPGLYWWRKLDRPKDHWRTVTLLPRGSFAPSWYSDYADSIETKKWLEIYGPGQWVRIPEPEGAE